MFVVFISSVCICITDLSKIDSMGSNFSWNKNSVEWVTNKNDTQNSNKIFSVSFFFVQHINNSFFPINTVGSGNIRFKIVSHIYFTVAIFGIILNLWKLHVSYFCIIGIDVAIDLKHTQRKNRCMIDTIAFDHHN